MEIIKLNLIPSGVNPTCHCSQYDNGRVIRIELFDGLTPYTLQSGDTVTLNVRKPDNHIVTTTLTATQGNKYVDLVTTEQICACVGYNLCDLTITNGTKVIGTLNFIMQIERDVLADGIPSQSVIEDLDELVAEAVGDNYYTKDEVDEALALKADKSELYNMLPTDTASGAVANFPDGADNVPVKSLVANIEAIQAGSGDPSPSNPRAISGWSACNVTRTGKNLINVTGRTSITTQTTLGTDIYIKAGTYTFSAWVKNNSSVQARIRLINRSDLTYKQIDINVGDNGTKSVVVNLTKEGLYFVAVNGSGSGYNVDVDNVQLEVGSTASAYEAYQADTKTINLGQTVYGGTLNVTTGKLRVTYGMYVFTGLENWTWNSDNSFWYCSKTGDSHKSGGNRLTSNGIVVSLIGTQNIRCYKNSNPDYIDSTTDMHTIFPSGAQLVYELATPIEVDLTPTEVKTLLGDNNIYCDTGDVAVNYRADIGLYIDKKLGGNVTRALNMTRVSMPTATPSIDEESNEEIEEPTETQDPEER
jgi:hypothetical protein